jgi:hypothetical protein
VSRLVYARITVADIASLSNLPLAPRVAPARRCLDDIFELIVYKEDLPMSDGLQCAADHQFPTPVIPFFTANT